MLFTARHPIYWWFFRYLHLDTLTASFMVGKSRAAFVILVLFLGGKCYPGGVVDSLF